jgi:hypothetical protein
MLTEPIVLGISSSTIREAGTERSVDPSLTIVQYAYVFSSWRVKGHGGCLGNGAKAR